MKTNKELLIEMLEKIPNELINQAYVVNLYILDEGKIRATVQGYYNSDVISQYYSKAKITSNGFVEFDIDENIKATMT